MKLKLNAFLTLIITAFISQASISAQFDDLYYDPEKDIQYTQESEYDDDGYYDVDEYNYEDDYYYDDYDYATRINRFRRPARHLDYYSVCYINNGWNTWGYDPFFDPFFGRSAFAINIGFGSPWWGFNRWNRWNRWNSWNSWAWGPSWNNWGWNSWNRWNNWGWNSWGWNSWGNNFYANNVFINNGWGGAGNWNNGINGWNRYDRVTNPNGRYYGSRKGGSSVSSVKGRLNSPRATNDYISSRVTDRDTRNSTTIATKGVKSYRRGDIAVNNTRTNTNRIYDRNLDRRDRNTYRGTTRTRTIDRGSSRTINRGSSRTINRGSSRTINRGSSRTINRGNTTKSINRTRTTTRTRTVSPRSSSSRNNSSFNSSRSSSRSSSSMNRSSNRSSSSRSATRSSSSRKRNN